MGTAILPEGNWASGPGGALLVGAIVVVTLVVAVVAAFVLMILFRTVECPVGDDEALAVAAQVAGLASVDAVGEEDLPVLAAGRCSRPAAPDEPAGDLGAETGLGRGEMHGGVVVAYGGSRPRYGVTEAYGLLVWAFELNRELEATARTCQRELIAELFGRCARSRARRRR